MLVTVGYLNCIFRIASTFTANGCLLCCLNPKAAFQPQLKRSPTATLGKSSPTCTTSLFHAKAKVRILGVSEYSLNDHCIFCHEIEEKLSSSEKSGKVKQAGELREGFTRKFELPSKSLCDFGLDKHLLSKSSLVLALSFNIFSSFLILQPKPSSIWIWVLAHFHVLSMHASR